MSTGNEWSMKGDLGSEAAVPQGDQTKHEAVVHGRQDGALSRALILGGRVWRVHTSGTGQRIQTWRSAGRPAGEPQYAL